MLKVARFDRMGLCAVAARFIACGERIVNFLEDSRVVTEPALYSLQLDRTRHLELHGNARYLAHRAFSKANSWVKWESDAVWLLAKQSIEMGNLVTFDYNTTEWTMRHPFVDHDGHRVAGFSQLTPHEQSRLLPHAAPWIKARMNEEI